MDVFEQVLEKRRRVGTLKVEVAAEYAEERKTMGNNHLIPSTPSSIVDPALIVDGGAILEGVGVAETAMATTIFGFPLAVS